MKGGKVVFNKKMTNNVMNNLSLSILGLFGSLHQSGRFTLKNIMQAIIDPHYRGTNLSARPTT